MKKAEKNKGITIIALVITIIVLLMLAGVAIQTLTGDNGLLSQAEEAKVASEESKVKEQIELVYQEYKIHESTNNEQEAIDEYMRKGLEKIYGEGNVTVTLKDEVKLTVEISITDHNNYIIYDGKVEENEKYTSENGTAYSKYETYTGTVFPSYNLWAKVYKNCDKMVSIELANCKPSYPYNCTADTFTGCNSLKTIKIPLGGQLGHYTFAGIPTLEYVELGSVGNPWTGAGYFMKSNEGNGYGYNNFGTPAGLTIVAYMNSYNAKAGFMGTPAANTTIIIRSAETGEILEAE